MDNFKDLLSEARESYRANYGEKALARLDAELETKEKISKIEKRYKFHANFLYWLSWMPIVAWVTFMFFMCYSEHQSLRAKIGELESDVVAFRARLEAMRIALQKRKADQ